MNTASRRRHRTLGRVGIGAIGLLAVASLSATAATDGLEPEANFGPYNEIFLAGGVGFSKALSPASPVVGANAPWSFRGWLRPDRRDGGPLVIAAIGDPSATERRSLEIDAGVVSFRLGRNMVVRAKAAMAVGSWHFISVSYDGAIVRLTVDDTVVESQSIAMNRVAPLLSLAPDSALDPAGEHHFGGAIAGFQIADHALEPGNVAVASSTRPDFALVPFHHVGVGWPWQERAWRGLLEPQPAWTLPQGNAPPDKPQAVSPPMEPAVQTIGSGRWSIGSWRLAPAAALSNEPLQLSTVGFDDHSWYRAVVPGTVLTTMIANGVYADPDIGLNNLAIPESLNRQDYWYRSDFPAPQIDAGQHLTLTFNGINYAAEVWLNGSRLGTVRGAFIRGTFDVTGIVKPGSLNAIAVRVSPPPHPGIPHEQSVTAGPGMNGGNLAIDGPTFIATEGWDWIPAIRDRNTGLWQSVELSANGGVRILDPHVVTRLPLPSTDYADIDIDLPLENLEKRDLGTTIEVRFDDVVVTKSVVLKPGISQVSLRSSEFRQLHVDHPKLWWPNGYGDPELHEMNLTVRRDRFVSDSRSLRFGIRQITYELSLFDRTGHLRRVEVDPTLGSARNERLVDTRHEAIKRTATGWAESLTPAGEQSAAVQDIATVALTPYLVIRVNGIPIAARGGSWGMDDSRKRVGRTRLEPYFRLHREAHLNIIRNWLGQDTEEVFYDLADEYGLLILNDFWASTQDFQVEPQDPQLFLNNAEDVIRRYRNHPSIAVWFGRNEGVPQPIINEGLADLVASLDGTRHYTGSSNTINLQGSGPYNWRQPQEYFTTLAEGFSVEVGTPSLASLDSIRASIPLPDRWPIGDVYAYHDWHFGGNGDTASFMTALALAFGAPSDLQDFERKAQMMNYVAYRAIFEGFQAHLWTKNSGRLLWMTHPSWPSNSWQIYSSDYDTAAAYYAVSKACEPLHAQLDLPDFRPAIVNAGGDARKNLYLVTKILTLSNRLIFTRTDRINTNANAVVTMPPVPLQSILASEPTVLVTLELRDPTGRVVSTNTYWESAHDADQRRLTEMPQQPLQVVARGRSGSGESVIDVEVRNLGTVPALLARLTALDSNGNRVLPAYYSDNYISVFPSGVVRIQVHCPKYGSICTSLSIRGWNVPEVQFPITRSGAE